MTNKAFVLQVTDDEGDVKHTSWFGELTSALYFLELMLEEAEEKGGQRTKLDRFCWGVYYAPTEEDAEWYELYTIRYADLPEGVTVLEEDIEEDAEEEEGEP